MLYCIDPSLDEPIMLLNQEIGNGGIDGAGFQAELLQLDSMGKKRIQVWINSIGGVVTDGMAIYNAILKSKTKVDTYNCGIAASIAAVIFQAGRKRIMADYSILMYHLANGGDDKTLAIINDAISKMIARSGLSRAKIDILLGNGDTFLDANQALSMGLADEIESSVDFNKPRMRDAANNRILFHSVCNKAINSNPKLSFQGAASAMSNIAAKHGESGNGEIDQAEALFRKRLPVELRAAACMNEIMDRNNQK